jgi:hypothetical protein
MAQRWILRKCEAHELRDRPGERSFLGRCGGSSRPSERIEFEFLGDWQYLLGSMAIEMDLDQRIYGSVGWPALEKAMIVAPMWA